MSIRGGSLIYTAWSEDLIGAVPRADKHAGPCLVDTVTSLAGLNDTKLSSGMPGEASSCFVRASGREHSYAAWLSLVP